MQQKCKARDILVKKSIGVTSRREVVLNTIIRSKGALTAKMILDQVRAKTSIDKVTLYRILDLFVDHKVLKRMSTPSGSMSYEVICDAHRPSHAHFCCRSCGALTCLDDVDLTDLTKQIQKKASLNARDLDLMVQGTCEDCRT